MVFALLAGLFGLLIGSFLNACIYRLPRDLTLWKPARSFCPSCERQIAWYDNLPLLSYLLLRGRCRNCAKSIPIRYFLVELLCGVMYFVIVLYFDLTAVAAKLMAFTAINLALIFTDLEERILPDEFTVGGTLLGLGFAWFVWLRPEFASLLLPLGSSSQVQSLAESLLASAFGYGVLRALLWAYLKLRGKEGMGLGDLKMAAMIGAFLGLTPLLLTLAVGSMMGAVLGWIAIRLRGEDASTYELPFGSFLGVAALGVAWLDAVQTL